METETEHLTYCSTRPHSCGARAILRARARMYELMSEYIPLEDMASVLDVGVSADRDCEFSNYFEYRYPFPERVTALSDQDASWMSDRFPGMKFVRGDARSLPSQDCSFDFVYSSAVIEHVGSRHEQACYLGELLRVAKRHVFITTPNRWFPLEMHSGFPFVHWLPPAVFRFILRVLGKRELALESNLNLLTKKDMLDLCVELVDSAKVNIVGMKFFGFPSNILVHVEIEK